MGSKDRWTHLWELFHEVLQRAPSERAAFLADTCGTDAELLQRLRQLIEAHGADAGILDRPIELAGEGSRETATLTQTAHEQIAPGETLAGRFRVVRFLGRGGMGAVYEAHDEKLDVAVALKTLLPSLARDETARRRFQKEITLARQVTHPNACRIFDLSVYETANGESIPFLTMELLEGETLAERLKSQGELFEEAALPILRQVAAALGAAHRVGVIHRDLKPANVMLVPGGDDVRAVVTDFGLARRSSTEEDPSTRMTREGQVLGTPSYMAPEQLRGLAITPATDVYALGLLAYEMVTNALPHEGTTPFSAAMKRLQDAPRSPRTVRPELDQRWEGVILRCLELDPQDRFSSVEDVTASLETDETVRLPSRVRASRRRLAWFAVAATVLVAALVVLLPRLTKGPATGSVDQGGVGTGAERESAPLWMLIAGFDNRTGESVLDGAVEYALERELNNSRVVSVVPRERVADVLGLMKKSPDLPIDAALGREIALRDGGIGAVLRGRVEKLGSTYVMSIDVVEPDGGQQLASLSDEAANQDEVLASIRRLATAVREALGEERSRMAAAEAELARVTTPSLRALQLYTQADRVIATPEGNKVAVELLRQAIIEDPTFASAHMHLAHALRNEGQPRENFLPFAEKAYELSETTPTRERFFIRGGYHSMRGEWEEAATNYEALLQLHPDHYWGLNNLVNHFHGRLERYSDAVPYAKRRSDVRPVSFGSAFSAARQTTSWANDVAAARPYVDRALALMESTESPPYPRAWVQLFGFHERWLEGDVEAASAEVDRIMQSQPEDAGVLDVLTGAALTLGRRTVARELVDRMPPEHPHRLVLAFLERDREGVARFLEVSYARISPLPRLEPLRIVMLVRSGFVDAGRTALADLEAQESRNTTVFAIPESVFEIVRGELALGEGKTEEAIERLRPALGVERATGTGTYFLGCMGLAGALEQQGDLEAAAAVLEDARSQKGRVYGKLGAGAFWLRALSQLRDLYHAMGEEEAAAGVEAELRELLRVADADHPLL